MMSELNTTRLARLLHGCFTQRQLAHAEGSFDSQMRLHVSNGVTSFWNFRRDKLTLLPSQEAG